MLTLPVLVAASAFAQLDAPKLELKDGDRIVWLGGTLVEREQRYGHWETALLAAHPDMVITVRNLGWSGDTVHAEARGRFDFGSPEKCFQQLVGLALELRPTVIFVSYGANEAFDGEAGLQRFEKGLEKLLDALKPANARVVLFTPIPFESGPAAERNGDVKKYAGVVRTVAGRRNLPVADIGAQIDRRRLTTPTPFPVLTENGLHFTDAGYKFTNEDFLEALGIRPWVGTPDTLTRWRTLDTEPLRKAVVAKNELFFYRWRPQNETYLFGFRKHEQGKNAAEVAEFDPLVTKAEDEIARLRKLLSK